MKARRLGETIPLRGAPVVVCSPFGQYGAAAASHDSLEGLLRRPETLVFWTIKRKN